jgi:predicted class III extradiol MEMO1 family dioxygenase
MTQILFLFNNLLQDLPKTCMYRLLHLPQDWQTPLGRVCTDKAAVTWLSKQHNIPVNEAVHAAEHSIENQLPFLVHAANCLWDPAAAVGLRQGPPAAEPHTRDRGSNSSSRRPVQPQATAGLSIVPISIGYLGHQVSLIRQYGQAVGDLLQHLRQQQQRRSPSRYEVVLVITSDFTHAGPWYKELPPAGLSLEEYMAQQDMPVLRVRRCWWQRCKLHDVPFSVSVEA